MKKKWLYLFLLPGLLVLTIFLIIPIVAVIGNTFLIEGQFSGQYTE